MDRAGVGFLAAIGAAASLLASVNLASLVGLMLLWLAALVAGLVAYGALPEVKKITRGSSQFRDRPARAVH